MAQCFAANDRWLIAITFLLVIVAGFSLCQRLPATAWLAVLTVDAYLLVILAFAALRSDGVCKQNNFVGWFFPSRITGLLLVGMFLFILVVGFATLYRGLDAAELQGELASGLDAVYFSFVTLTTLGYGDLHPLLAHAKFIVIVQLISGTLLLFGVFPLLISRIATF